MVGVCLLGLLDMFCLCVCRACLSVRCFACLYFVLFAYGFGGLFSLD